eukprot:3399069-Pyramimonas_sp.AAC.1
MELWFSHVKAHATFLRAPFTFMARKLYEFPAVTKVDGSPPASNWPTRPGRTMCQPGVGLSKIVRDLEFRFKS